MAQKFVVFNSKKWEKYFAGVKVNLKRSNKILRAAFGTVGFQDIINHFKQESGSDGKWPKRARSTQEMYASLNKKNAKFNPSNKLLVLSGNLRKAFLPTNVKELGAKRGILFFNPIKYSGTHDRGSRKKKIPKREFMWLSSRAKVGMQRVILGVLAGDKKI